MANTSPAVISVVDPSGRTHQVMGYAAAIIALVLADQEFINSWPAGHVRVDFAAGGTVYEAMKVVRK